MGDGISDVLQMIFQQGGIQALGGKGGTTAPSGASAEGGGNDAAIRQGIEGNLKPHTSLAPMRMNPKMKQSNLGVDIGLNILKSFVPQIGGALQTHIKQQKETQINQVVNDFATLHDSWETAQAMTNNDSEKAKQMFMKDPRVLAIMGDKKKLKLLSKAFNIDLMNPEKTQDNVAFQGLQRFLKIKDAKGQVEQVKKMREQAKQKTQAAQSNQGGGQQNNQGLDNVSPEQLAGNFLKMWPTSAKQPSMADAKSAAEAEKDLVQRAVDGEPKTEFQAWYKAARAEGPVSAAMVEAHHEAMKLKPVDQLIGDAIDAIQSGDVEGGKEKIKLAHDITQAVHPIGHQSVYDWISAANSGDKEAKKNLDVYRAMQDERAEAYGKGRAKYQYMAYTFPDGTIRPMSGIDMFDYIRTHPNEQPPIPTGRLTPTQDIAIQQLNTEAGPQGSKSWQTGALKGVYDNLAAFDNAKDRAIFANAMNKVEHSSDWLATMKNGLTQVEVKNLSPEGKDLYVNLQRLAETMGRFRSAMGLPSTDQSMSLSLALLPGPATPDSETARKQLDNLNQMINQANVPALGPQGTGKDKQPPQKKKADF